MNYHIWQNKFLKSSKNIDCIITLGCVIKGETAHFEFISSACANALAQLTLQSKVPIMFGVITAYNKSQALDRSKINFDNKDNLNIGYNVANCCNKNLNHTKRNIVYKNEN